MTRGSRDAATLDDDDAALRRARLVRFALVSLTIALLLAVVVEVVATWIPAVQRGEAPIGYDLQIYVERTRSWLDGNGFYLPRQLNGPYLIQNGDALYPPTAILLFLPWALGAPAILWWLIPLGIAVVSIRRLRPPLWAAGVLIGLVLVYGRTIIAIILGNPSIWVFAAILAGAAFGWPALVALIKPVLAPFALIGASRRSWWIGLAVALVLSVPFAGMWLDYARVLADARTDRDLTYPLGELPVAVALAVVGLASRGGPQLRTALARLRGQPSDGQA